METVEGPAKTESSFFISLFHAQFGKRSVIVNGVLVAAEGKKRREAWVGSHSEEIVWLS